MISIFDLAKFVFFTNGAVVSTSLVRSHVVFKFLNYVTDKIVRVVLIITLCASVRERPRAGERERESRLCAFRT